MPHLIGIEIGAVCGIQGHTGDTSGMRIAILGGGPGGYEAALVASQLGAEVVVVDRDGLGGACVLADCVPSKTLIATSETMTTFASSDPLGVRLRSGARPEDQVTVDLPMVNARVKALALAQSLDIARRLAREGVEVVRGSGRLVAPDRLVVRTEDGEEGYGADTILITTGGSPRQLPGVDCDGDRILNWQQLYDLPTLPEHLVVIGSGVTGAEFASAYLALGSDVTLVSSRDRVMPSEDEDAALLLEDVFTRRGMEWWSNSRTAARSRAATASWRSARCPTPRTSDSSTSASSPTSAAV
jgi:pyruvate/2-oxoglutarate dehydrogenase complex dihydrolipoamide dehydrogenase (E3) component